MKFQTSFSLFLFLLFLLSCGSNDMLSRAQTIDGTWLLEKVEKGDKVQKPYILTVFDKNGKVSMRDKEIGKWKKAGDKIIINSPLFPKLDGTGDIVKLNDEKLVYKKGDLVFTYIRYNKNLIIKSPVYKKLLGTWKMGGDQTSIFLFDKGFQFTQLVRFENNNGTMTTKGQWLLLPDNKTLVLEADIEDLRGESKIIQLNDDLMELIYKGVQFQLDKLPATSPPEALVFTYEEIENTETDEHDLPWSEEALYGYLKNHHEISYERKTYEKEVKTFLTDYLISKIYVDENKPQIKFVYYLQNKEEEIKQKEVIKAHLQNTYNRFFPEKAISPYRIVSNNEKINVNGTTYYCTLVEGFDGDEKVKYWMINDMPGIFAKIIRDNPQNPSYYISYEINDIQ